MKTIRFCVLFVAVLVWTNAGRAEDALRFVAWKYGMAGQDEFYRDLAREFERAHPGRRIRIELGDWQTAHPSIQRWAGQGGGPDLATMPDVWLAEFAPVLERYTAQLPQSFLARFQPVMLDRAKYPGGVPGLVWAASTKALFYRTDLFQHAGLKPPASWDELVSAARKLNHPPEMAGLSMPGARELDTADSFYFLLWSLGGEIIDASGRVRLDSPAGLKALRLYRDLAIRYKVKPGNLLACNKQCAEDIFARGEAAMVQAGPWGVRAFRSSPAHPPFAVVPLPPAGTPITQLVTDHLVLFRSSRLKPAALEFIRFAYGTEWRRRWARLGMVPELKEVAEDPFFRDDPAWRVFISVLPRSRWIPLMRWEPMDRAFRDTLARVLAGALAPEPAIKELSATLERLARQSTPAAQGRE